MKKSSVLLYLASVVLISVIMLLIYATVQQTYRTGLDDPQLQMARDISLKLEQGKSIESIVSPDPIDLTKSLSPFLVLYDEQGKAFRSNAVLNGKLPQVPAGLFDVVNKKGEHRVSWQPEKAVRIAMVIIKSNSKPVQFVAAGRSMAEVEERIQQMRAMVFIAWVISLAIICITAILNHFLRLKNK